MLRALANAESENRSEEVLVAAASVPPVVSATATATATATPRRGATPRRLGNGTTPR
jgi:hypothetical protein